MCYKDYFVTLSIPRSLVYPPSPPSRPRIGRGGRLVLDRIPLNSVDEPPAGPSSHALAENIVLMMSSKDMRSADKYPDTDLLSRDFKVSDGWEE